MANDIEILVSAGTAGEVGRALARGLAVETTPEVAWECGAIPGDPGDLEDALESHRRPYGPGGPASEPAGRRPA